MSEGIIVLPTLERFPDKTDLEKEQPGLELSKSCDYCDRDCWVSLKKRTLIDSPEIGTCCICYDCFEKMTEKNPESLRKIIGAIRI